jgi:uncharacterized DUF497 family protein
MLIWDDKKNTSNKTKHGISFDAVHSFDWNNSVILDRTYPERDGEIRWAAIGMLRGKLHTIIFTYRADDIRIISLRRSNKGEESHYEQKT